LIRKILVSKDGSEPAEHSLYFALDLAQHYSAEIHLLTVVPPVFLPAHSFNVVKTEAMANANLQLEDIFRETLCNAEKKGKLKNVKISTILEKGDPDQKILEEAKNGCFDLIVMGSRGLGHRGYGLGSVSASVADEANCPVLIVK
jgi:nucleotide-binding universal stress UspA family protein